MGIDAAQVLRGKVRKNFTHLLCLNIPVSIFMAMAIALSDLKSG